MNIDNSLNEELFNNLSAAATNPSAEGKASGVAFEEEITKIFRYMGFEAKRIGGSGNTDVVVKWKNDDGRGGRNSDHPSGETDRKSVV